MIIVTTLMGCGIMILKMVMVFLIWFTLGEEKYLDGNYYKGDFIKGKKSGKGYFYLANGTFYQGEFKDDTLHGYVNIL